MYHKEIKENGSAVYVSLSDYQRKKVYAAERVWLRNIDDSITKSPAPNASLPFAADISDPYYKFPSIRKAQQFVNHLIENYSTRWITDEDLKELRTLKLVFRKGNAKSTANHWSMEISLAPKWGLTLSTIVHEFAHILSHLRADDTGHGRMFVRMHLFLVRHIFGTEMARDLFRAYKKHKVNYFGTDMIDVKNKIQKMEKEPKATVISFNWEDKRKPAGYHRIQKVYKVPNFNNWWGGRGRLFEWNSLNGMVNNRETEIHWEIYNGKWAYFYMQDEDQWYKISIEGEDGLPDLSLSYGNTYTLYQLIYTPHFLDGLSEEELETMTRTAYDSLFKR